MNSTRQRLRWLFALLASSLVLVLGAQPAAAATYVPLTGDGSSWAQPAISQWGRDVSGRGITVNFSGDGSAAGRQHYLVGQADFAASDISFLTTADPFNGGKEDSAYSYSYVPIVAGGTAFLYNLQVGGKHVTNLRLSGTTIAKIFTGQITNWDDAAITHDYGAKLPSQKITVVTRSDGSGASYMFSQWLNRQYYSIWHPFCVKSGGTGACGPTEFYPGISGGQQRPNSSQVASYVTASYGAGSIAYDEYAYALASHIPVVKLLNAAGYYSLPTPSNVAIALQAAVINNDSTSLTYLMQNLNGVYVNRDPRTYPLSSYSYLIIPRQPRVYQGHAQTVPDRWSDAKGLTMSTWMNYVLCGAQQKSGALGYSPLPKNLVVGGFAQVKNMPGAGPVPDSAQLNGCNNPTYSNGVNHLITGAPQPSPCDKVGAPLNCVVTSTGKAAQRAGGNSGIFAHSGAQNRNVSTSDTRANGNGQNGSLTTSTDAGAKKTGNATTSTTTNTVDALGNPVSQAGAADTNADAASGGAGAVPVSLASHSDQSWTLSTLTALDIAAAVILPGLFGAWLRRRKRGTT